MAHLPASRQQAQDTLFEYYQKTLRELPDGYTLDGSRYGNAPTLIVCDDNARDGMNAPAAVNDWRDLHTPPGTDYPALIAQIGDIWRGWGWRVTERDGFDKPNRFGYAPDGYWLNVEAAGGYFPSFGGGSPCFPGDETRFRPIPAPWVITREGLQYEKPRRHPPVTRTCTRVATGPIPGSGGFICRRRTITPEVGSRSGPRDLTGAVLTTPGSPAP